MGFLHPHGVCSHDENGRAGSGGEHLVLMSWPRERGHSQIPGHVFFSSFPTLSLSARGESYHELHFILKVCEDKPTNFKVFPNPLQTQCAYGVSRAHRQKLMELENHSEKQREKKHSISSS